MSEYLGTDAVELAPDPKEVWLPVADHDVADVGLLQAVHYAGWHRALREVILSHLEIIKCKSDKKLELDLIFTKWTSIRSSEDSLTQREGRLTAV